MRVMAWRRCGYSITGHDAPRARAPAVNAGAPYSLRCCDWSTGGAALRKVRNEVFIIEQGIPESLEWDSDDSRCVHALAEDREGAPIGCARLLADGHIGRVAVLRRWRRRGVGGGLISLLIDEARRLGHPQVVINAQLQAMPFYARHGFVATGDDFDEAGIPHRVMVLRLA
jgi:predicted GNAT family N-acyltransferase